VEDLYKGCLKASKELFNLIHTPMDESFYLYEGIGAGGDRSSKIDLMAEEIYVTHLKPFGKIVSEESGEIGEGEFSIILDPIDGSDNLLSRFPYFGSSVAVKKGDETLFSFIVNLANGDYFVKYENCYKKGSLTTGRTKDVRLNRHSKVGLFEKAYANPDMVEELKKESLKFRSPGAVALSLAYAPYVKFVLFKGPLRAYDIEAGLHQCQTLFVFKNQDSIIVSKERDIFERVKKILRV